MTDNNQNMIKQIFDLVTELNTDVKLLTQKICSVEKKNEEQSVEIKQLSDRITKNSELVAKNAQEIEKHKTQHETQEKAKNSNISWINIITALGVLAVMILQLIK